MAKIVRGEERNRPGKWLLDWTDETGRRRVLTCQSKAEAQAQFIRLIPISQQKAGTSSVAHDITLARFVEEIFLPEFKVANKARSYDVYKLNLDRHILPALGAVQLRHMSRTMVTTFARRQEATTPAKSSRKLQVAIIRAVLAKALFHGAIQVNPAVGVVKELKLSESTKTRSQRIGKQAYDAEQMAALLDAAKSDARHYPLFTFLSLTGCRISEALGLEWDDVDFETKKITIARAISKGHTEVPKSGHGRVIDLCDDLAGVLRKLLAARKADKLARGWSEIPAPVFCTNVGTPLEESKCRKALGRAVKAAKTPHFTLHGFRHSFASIMIAAGESPAYVQKMLGHSSIALTVDLYGSHLAHEGAGVNKLAASILRYREVGSK